MYAQFDDEHVDQHGVVDEYDDANGAEHVCKNGDECNGGLLCDDGNESGDDGDEEDETGDGCGDGDCTTTTK